MKPYRLLLRAVWMATLLLPGLLLSLSLSLPLSPPAARADGIVLPPPRCFEEPIPLPGPVPNPGPLPPVPPRPIRQCWLTIRYHRVNVEIADQVATTRVDQVFANETGRDLEGTYVFPLPEDAAVTGFSMWVDGEQIEGQVLTREAARRLYESIVRRNRDPALLEYVGRGAFQANVFPIPAGGERRIELEYTQVLRQDGGLVRYVYPLSTERFSVRPLQQASVTVSIRSPEPLKSIYSPSHEVDVTRTGDHAATVSWEQANVTPQRNFELVYGVALGTVGLHVLSHRPAGEDGYFLLLAAPRVELPADRVVAKDVTLVFDTSGSMAGQKIEQAKAALRYVISRLNAQDRFNVVSFASTVTTFAETMQPVAAREQALAYVDKLVASGGTNINDALVTALQAARSGTTAPGGRPHLVIFVTDGLPTVGPQQPEQIVANVGKAAEAAGSRARIFTFGVGFDVNTVLLDQLAGEFGGVSAYVKPNENLEEAISIFYNKVGAPVLTDLRLEFGGAGVYDLFPAQLPDLYAGSQLVVAGRYRQPGTFDVALTGTADGRTQRFAAPNVRFAAGTVEGRETLPRLWASRKIGFLLSEIRLHGASSELVDEIVALATRYGIATPYTSIFVPEPGQPVPLGTPVPLVPQSRAMAADALRQGLAAAPASGAAAVQASEATRALQQAQAAPAAPAERVKVVEDKTFVLVDSVWTDVSTGEAPPPEAERIRIEFASDDYFALLEEHPALARYLSVGMRVLVDVDGVWLEIYE